MTRCLVLCLACFGAVGVAYSEDQATPELVRVVVDVPASQVPQLQNFVSKAKGTLPYRMSLRERSSRFMLDVVDAALYRAKAWGSRQPIYLQELRLQYGLAVIRLRGATSADLGLVQSALGGSTPLRARGAEVRTKGAVRVSKGVFEQEIFVVWLPIAAQPAMRVKENRKALHSLEGFRRHVLESFAVCSLPPAPFDRPSGPEPDEDDELFRFHEEIKRVTPHQVLCLVHNLERIGRDSGLTWLKLTRVSKPNEDERYALSISIEALPTTGADNAAGK